jgi:hypothetical protein
MEPSLSKKRLADYMRNLSQLVKDVADQKISHDEAAECLSVLKAEHHRLEKSGLFPLNMKVPLEKEKDMPQKLNKVSPKSYTPSPSDHELDFKCQCKSCVSKHTISMNDQLFLKSLRILWNTPAPAREADKK